VRYASLKERHTALTSVGFEVIQVMQYRLRLEFSSWIERMKTPELHVATIQSLQRGASETVTRYFEIDPDGSLRWTPHLLWAVQTSQIDHKALNACILPNVSVHETLTARLARATSLKGLRPDKLTDLSASPRQRLLDGS
jgi:hypothetical protein